MHDPDIVIFASTLFSAHHNLPQDKKHKEDLNEIHCTLYTSRMVSMEMIQDPQGKSKYILYLIVTSYAFIPPKIILSSLACWAKHALNSSNMKIALLVLLSISNIAWSVENHLLCVNRCLKCRFYNATSDISRLVLIHHEKRWFVCYVSLFSEGGRGGGKISRGASVNLSTLVDLV